MKILMVNKFLYPNGGSETYIFELAKQLGKMGHEVQFFGMEHPERIAGNSAESYTSNMDFHAGGIRKLIYPFKIIYSHETRVKMRPVLENFQPDVVHLNNFNFQLTPSVIYETVRYGRKKNKQIPLIYTAHDYQWICPNHMMKLPKDQTLCSRCVERGFMECGRHRCIHGSRIRSMIGSAEALLYQFLHTYGKVDTIICPSRFMKKMLSSDPVLADKTVVLHNFINKMPETQDIAQKSKEDYVLYMGRYDREKGIGTLLKVCSELADIPFVFAGKGALEKEVNKVANVRNKGFISGTELERLIRNARFMVFPSEWYENCPFSVMEAQMCATPVLASRLGGTPELMKENITGELFEAGNAAELKAKIRKLWDNAEICEKYSRNCGTIKYDTAEAYCDKLIRLYTKDRQQESVKDSENF